MTIGQNIRALRKARGLTQARLGALCHISGASIGSYEKGATLPRRRVLEQLSAALDVPVERGGPARPRCPSVQRAAVRRRFGRAGGALRHC